MLVTFLLMMALGAGAAVAAETQPVLSGDFRIHDPSVIYVDGAWVAFGTGAPGLGKGAIKIRTSEDGLAWKDAGFLGKGIPAWVEPTLHVKPPELWAPTVSEHGGTTYLYYAASVFGINVSAIGLATNAAFDPRQPGQGWVDQGLVLQTAYDDTYNAIDPTRIDTPDGRAYLAFGSYWTGIKMREIDPASGKVKAGDGPLYDLASRNGGAIEASSIVRHGNQYFLFVSFDRCCAGTGSTYRIMVGRADAVTGPYLAKDGTPMMQGGATEVQKSTGRYIGPGGQEAFIGPGGEAWLAYHYYDGADNGVSKLEVAPINWTADNWPTLAPLPVE